MFVVATASALHITMPTFGFQNRKPQLCTQKSLLVQSMTIPTNVVEGQKSQESLSPSCILRDWMRSASNGDTSPHSVKSISWSSPGKLSFTERSVLAGTLVDEYYHKYRMSMILTNCCVQFSSVMERC